jgi:uncharacterized lipoprotein YmbA
MKNRGHFGWGWIALAGLLGGSGCLSVPIPQAEADPARFYVLNTTTPAAAAGGEARNGPGVHLLPVEVASYLRSRTMIVRLGENEIEFREFARWGETLETGIARVVREELLARGAARHVTSGGFAAPKAGHDVTLTLRVLACEGGADGSVQFHAAWELLPSSPGVAGGAVRGDYRAADLRWDGKTEASLAAQLSVAVAGLAGEIAGALGRRTE